MLAGVEPVLLLDELPVVSPVLAAPVAAGMLVLAPVAGVFAVVPPEVSAPVDPMDPPEPLVVALPELSAGEPDVDGEDAVPEETAAVPALEESVFN